MWCVHVQENREINERVTVSLATVRKELSALPFPVKLVLSYTEGKIHVQLDLDSYQLVMEDIIEVCTYPFLAEPRCNNSSCPLRLQL